MGAFHLNNVPICRISWHSHCFSRCHISVFVCWRHWRGIYKSYFTDGDLCVAKQIQMVLRKELMGYDNECHFKYVWDNLCGSVFVGYDGGYNY